MKGSTLDYAELHLHTQFSIMDGLSTADEYCRRAHEIGIDTLACTDHSTAAGHREFLKACTEHNINAILGVEAHLAGGMDKEARFERKSKAKRQDGEDSELYYHMILLAKNDNGLKNIYKMEEAAWNESFYNKPLIGLDLLEQYHEDVIMTTACVSGPIGRNIMNGKEDYALQWLHKLKDIFHDDMYVELQEHNDGIHKGLNHQLIKMADENNIKLVATSDCHHASPDDLWLQEALLILNTNPKKNPEPVMSKTTKMDFLEKMNYLYPERKMTFEHADVHLSNADEKRVRYEAQGITRTDIYTNTLEVADKVG